MKTSHLFCILAAALALLALLLAFPPLVEAPSEALPAPALEVDADPQESSEALPAPTLEVDAKPDPQDAPCGLPGTPDCPCCPVASFPGDCPVGLPYC